MRNLVHTLGGIAASAQGGHLFHVGQVQSIQWTDTPPDLTVTFSGNTVPQPGIRFGSWYYPNVNDWVIAIQTGPPRAQGGGDWLVLGTLGGVDQGTVLGECNYEPSSRATPSFSSSSVTALDTTNATVSFTAPPSGQVRIRVVFSGVASTASAVIGFGLVTHNTTTAVGNWTDITIPTTAAAEPSSPVTVETRILSLTPGTAYQYDFAGTVSSGNFVLGIQGGVPAVSPTSPFYMIVTAD
ncbi:MAG: hypothetical protein WBF51_04195 [Candidatus Dormiibacterota bacterium]